MVRPGYFSQVMQLRWRAFQSQPTWDKNTTFLLKKDLTSKLIKTSLDLYSWFIKGAIPKE